jgi:hypothetical protein
MDFLEDGGVPASQANKTTMSVHYFDDLEAEQKLLQNGSDFGLALSLRKLCHLLIRVVCKRPFQTKPPTSHNASPARSENPRITSRKLLQWVKSSKIHFWAMRRPRTSRRIGALSEDMSSATVASLHSVFAVKFQSLSKFSAM